MSQLVHKFKKREVDFFGKGLFQSPKFPDPIPEDFPEKTDIIFEFRSNVNLYLPAYHSIPYLVMRWKWLIHLLVLDRTSLRRHYLCNTRYYLFEMPIEDQS